MRVEKIEVKTEEVRIILTEDEACLLFDILKFIDEDKFTTLAEDDWEDETIVEANELLNNIMKEIR